MVIATILKHLQYNIVCVHINYDNRKESSLEADFLNHWTHNNGITFVRKDIEDMKRGEINRKVYEEATKTIRFDLYKEVMETHDGESIILGHHDDDIVENVFNNICRGRDLLDLTVMRKDSTILGTHLSRPLIGQRKEMVYKFAHRYKAPYFKDTTPLWSLRGTFRNRIFTILNETYSGVYDNLLSISSQSDQWEELITSKMIDPYLSSMVFEDASVTLNISDHRAYPFCFWRRILSLLFHKYHQSAPPVKSIQNLVQVMNRPQLKIQLTKNAVATVYMDEMKIQFV